MRQGYKKYSDGLWRRLFNVGESHQFMQVRSEDGTLLETINGKAKITAALARVRLLTNDDESLEKSTVQPLDEPGR